MSINNNDIERDPSNMRTVNDYNEPSFKGKLPGLSSSMQSIPSTNIHQNVNNKLSPDDPNSPSNIQMAKLA